MVGKWKVARDRIYDMLSDEGKIALKTLEPGLRIAKAKTIDPTVKYVMVDEEDALYYVPEPGSGSWLARLTRELEGEVSLRTIDKYLDKLLDERILKPPVRSVDPFMHQIMEHVIDNDGKEKWVRSFYVSNEHVPDLLLMFKATHRFSLQ